MAGDTSPRAHGGEAVSPKQTVPDRRLSSATSTTSAKSPNPTQFHDADEFTPLLARGDASAPQAEQSRPARSASSDDLAGEHSSTKSGKRISKPIVIALSGLTVLVLAIIAFGFAAPAVVEEYARQAAVFKPTNLYFEEFTPKGLRARVQGDFVLDATRVRRQAVRDLGRFSTWIARAVHIEAADIEAHLPDYNDVLLGVATLPPFLVSLRNGDITSVDMPVEVEPRDVDSFRRLALEWLHGELSELRVEGRTTLQLQSGILRIGKVDVSQDLTFESRDIPSIPQYNITKFNIHDGVLPGYEDSIVANAAVEVFNDYPLSFTAPPVSLSILVPGCAGQEDMIRVATAMTDEVAIRPYSLVHAEAIGVLRRIPDTLITTCPGTDASPLDALLQSYMHGAPTTFFLRGAEEPVHGTPKWLAELMQSVTVPVAITGHAMNHVIDEFTLQDVHFQLPDLSAEPDSPAAQPRVSALIKVRANLPQEMNFDIEVPRVRARSSVYYKDKMMGHLNLDEWRKANSTTVPGQDGQQSQIIIESKIADAPLNITDHEVMSDVVSAILFGTDPVRLGVKADVDVAAVTTLGEFIIRDIPAEGIVPIKGVSNGTLTKVDPRLVAINLLAASRESLRVHAVANATNPTPYAATIPYADINILSNGSVMGNATLQDLHIVPGENALIAFDALWGPIRGTGSHNATVARDTLSRFVSGMPLSLSVRLHPASIPAMPGVGAALSNISIDIPTPRIRTPKTPDDSPDGEGGQHPFIVSATMHLWSSSATFVLESPFTETTFYITHINATAFYNETEPVGTIIYDLPMAVPPGRSESPRLPVEWSLNSVGYDAVRDALGGTLALDSEANIGVKLGVWTEKIWYKGRGIGAHIRI